MQLREILKNYGYRSLRDLLDDAEQAIAVIDRNCSRGWEDAVLIELSIAIPLKLADTLHRPLPTFYYSFGWRVWNLIDLLMSRMNKSEYEAEAILRVIHDLVIIRRRKKFRFGLVMEREPSGKYCFLKVGNASTKPLRVFRENGLASRIRKVFYLDDLDAEEIREINKRSK